MSMVVSTSILVIGSDLHFCYLMRRYVRESAHPLLFAGPDEKALELAQREQPALIVLEDGLHDLKGQQIIKTLKSSEHTCEIPVALCSWHDEEVTALDNGADIYLRMPILYGDFLAILNNLGI
jgi:DNA-binding response OmpR family regulator